MRGARFRSASGSALVEAVVVMPMLLLILFGLIDFSRLFHDGVAVASAARAGVAYGSQTTTTAADTAGIVQAALDDADDVAGVTATADRECFCGATAVACTTTSCGSGGTPRVYVVVTVNKTFNTLIPYPGIPSSVNLTRQARMRAQ